MEVHIADACFLIFLYKFHGIYFHTAWYCFCFRPASVVGKGESGRAYHSAVLLENGVTIVVESNHTDSLVTFNKDVAICSFILLSFVFPLSLPLPLPLPPAARRPFNHPSPYKLQTLPPFHLGSSKYIRNCTTSLRINLNF